MKEKIKYIVALLIAATISVVFVPLMKIGVIKISLFDIVKIGLQGYGNDSYVELFVGNALRDLEIYVYVIVIFMIVLLFHAVMVAVLSAKVSYIYAIASGIVMNIIVFIVYAGIKDAYEDIKMAVMFFGQGDSIILSKAPVIIWLGCSIVAIGLSIAGLVMMMKKTERIQTGTINPEDFYYGKNPWQNAGNKNTQYQKVKPIHNFYGGIKGTTGMFSNKIYLLEELVPVSFVKQGTMVFLMKQNEVDDNLRMHIIDEVLAEVYYVPQYEEYVVKPMNRLKVYLISGQPLGKGREYYLPRETELYLCKADQKFILA